MLERIVEIQDAVKSSIAILGATSLPNLTPEDWLLCYETCKALKCFEEASKYLSGEKYLTASQLLIIAKGITRVLKMILTSDSSDYHYLPTTCDFVRALLDLTNSRFENIENSNTIRIATFLDPRCKLQPFTSAKQATLRDSIIKLVAQEINREGSCENIAVSTKSSLDPTSIFYVWNAREAVPQSVESPTAQAIIEIDKYLNEKLISRNNLPLSWWKQNQAIFPHLAKLVRKKCNVLCSYKSKLSSDNVFIYTWTEDILPKASNEIASAVFHCLCSNIEKFEKVTTIRLVADGCSGQNKNTPVLGMLCKYLLDYAPERIKILELLFPIVGHSFLPPDHVFAQVEKMIKKNEVIPNPQGYYNIFDEHGTVLKSGSEVVVQNWKETCTEILKGTHAMHFSIKKCKRCFIERNKQKLMY
ncbi:unnamed protein product [Euphydryas editha]|uniref:HAT C-terminal dimerisation domain-containing protein n=1 Tax=Euphydryas editha TaxID=104508 RepID=A0AAU9UNE6_EUPED|nr:unnamed protein product [Euphydryas editha]